MKVNNKVYKAVLGVFLVLSAVLSYFRFDMLKDNNAIDNLGLYTDKAAGNMFGVFVFILIAINVVFAFIISRSTFDNRKANMMWTVSSFLCMLFLICSGISLCAELVKTPATVLSAYETTANSFDILLFIEIICVFAAAVYFFTDAVKCTKPQKEDKHSIIALIPVVYLAIRAIRMFMDDTTQINASGRSFSLLFLVVMMMFFVSETEFSVPLGTCEKTDKGNSKRIARYVGFGIVGAELAIIFSISSVVVNFSDPSALVSGLSDIALGVFAAVRLLSVKVGKEE